jgi:hypothetical protein
MPQVDPGLGEPRPNLIRVGGTSIELIPTMSMQIEDTIEILKNFNLIQQAWMGLFIRMHQLDTLMRRIQEIYEPLLDVIAQFCDDPFEEEFTSVHERLIGDVHEFNRMLVGMETDLNHRYPNVIGNTDPSHYTWNPVETETFNPAHPVTLGNNQLSLYDRVLSLLIPRAQAYLERCQRVHRGITAVQRRFKSRHYVPGASGARSAEADFASQCVAKLN